MEGNSFWNGEVVSPYCSIRFRKSFLPAKLTPCNSEISRSSQFAAGNNSATDSEESFVFKNLDFVKEEDVWVNIKKRF